MKLLQLQYFQVLATVLHYTKASQILHISQPNLSYAINELEKELGVPLFSRENKKVELTVYGSNFLDYVNKAINILNDGVKNTRSIKKDTVNSIIKIGYLYSTSKTVVPLIVKSFRNDKNIKFMFMQNVQAGLVDALQKDKLDFVLSADTDPSMVSMPLIEQELFLIVSKDNPLSLKKSVTFKEIAHNPFILVDSDSALWKLIKNKFDKFNFVPDIVTETRECGAALEYVAKNVGITIIPDTPFDKSLPVTKVKISTPGFKRHIYLSWKNDYVFVPLTEKVRDKIIKLF